MVEKDLYRRFVGNVCLYRELTVREPPTFLRRNLDQALDAHERLLRKGVTSANERIDSWNYETSDMLQNLIENRGPVLRINALQLRRLESNTHGTWKSLKQRRSDHVREPTWLPESDEEFRVPCRVIISVQDARSPDRALYTHPELTTAIGRVDDEGELYYDIEFRRPCLIELGQLFVAKEAGSDGCGLWKRTVTLDYLLEVSIQCQDSNNTAELFSRLESREHSEYPEVPASEGAVQAVWKDLPACPEIGTLLPLKRRKGHKAVEMKYGLDISMGWSKRTETPLIALNRLRVANGSHQLPTPSASDVSERTREDVKICYDFNEGMQTRTHSVKTLCCVFCAGDREYGSFSRLLLHYKISHDHFVIQSSQRQNAEGQKQISVVITLADKPAVQQAASDSKNPVQQEWVAPDKPFDIFAHVGGDEHWTGGNRTQAPRKRGRPAKARNRDSERMSGTGVSQLSSQVQARQPPRSRVNLAEVRDLPEVVMKRHTAPVVPGVKFYHTHSKQPIQLGETVGDDEDEGADVRLAQSQRRNLREHGLSGEEVDFHQAFNQHLDTEQSASKTLMRDGLVRFERTHRRRLQVEWGGPFKTRLKHLFVHGVVEKDVMDYCLQRTQDVGEEGSDIPKGERVGASDTTMNIQQADDDMELIDALAPSEALVNRDNSTPLSRKSGKFAKRKSSANDTTQDNTQNGPSRAKKPHRWSGGGADRDIIKSGQQVMYFSSSLGPSPNGDALAKQTSEPATTTATAAPPGMGRKTSRMRYEAGDFHPFEDTETTDPSEGTNSLNGGAAQQANTTGAKQKRPAVKGRCMCGEQVVGGRGCVACDELECARQDFHMACVGLTSRTLGWKCVECSASSFA